MPIRRITPLIFLLTILMASAAPPRAQAAPAPVPDIVRYYTILHGGQRIGYDHFQRNTTPAGTIKSLSDSLIKVSMLGTSLDVATQAIVEYAADGRTPISYALTLTQGQNATTIKCRFHGRIVDWSRTAGGQTANQTITLAPGTYVLEDNDVWRDLLRNAAASKKPIQATVFTPLLGRSDTITLMRGAGQTKTIAGKPVHCDRWTTDLPSLGGPQQITLDLRGDSREMVEMHMVAQNLTIQLADKAALKGIVNFDVTSRAFAVTDTTLPSTALTKVTIHAVANVLNEKITAASLQQGDRQSFHGTVKNGIADGVFTVNAFKYDGAHAAAFPYSPETAGPNAEWLKPDPLVESDDPEIRSLAAKLTEHAQTGWEAAAKIGHWVFDNITYRITGSSAKVCLTNKEGDCGPHTMLTVALCRAAGIPARPAGGALYTSLLGGSYGQHYWVNVWMGPADGWVPMDPTSGEIGTLSPTHLTLWNLGGLGSLSVKVLDYAPKAAPVAAAPIAIAARHSNGLTKGYKEKFVFKLDGNEVGSQTAILDSIAGDVQSWKFGVKLEIPQHGKILSITEAGTFSATGLGNPVMADLSAETAGMRQDARVNFDKTVAHTSIHIGDVRTRRDVPLTGAEFIGLNNNPTVLSLALRSIDLTAKETAIPFLFVDSLQTATITFSKKSDETLLIGGKAVDCQTYFVTPINETFWVEKATGALIKASDTRQKLEMIREE